MISDAKLKEKLRFAYEICDLYLKTGASATEISIATEVPVSTVKKQLTMIRKRKKDFIRLLPELGGEIELESMQKLIDEQIEFNIRTNKWNAAEFMGDYFTQKINDIKSMYINNSQEISEESKQTIINLRLNGESFRKISSSTGISLSTIHKIINTKPTDEVSKNGIKR